MIPIERIKEQITIPSLLSYHGYHLGSRGRTVCPIHRGSNKTSFSYTPTKFHCFTCGACGDVIALQMAITGTNFKDAIQTLAAAYGINHEARPRAEPKLDALELMRHESNAKAVKTDRLVYSALSDLHARLMRNGCRAEDLERLELWLDENMEGLK